MSVNMNMYQSKISLLDLPHEILLIIFKKLSNIDVLYSLLDVDNQRLNPIVQDKTFTTTLNFTLITSTDDVVSIAPPILDRFRTNILPQIDQNIRSLVLESKSMERILHAGDYPHLTELKLFNFTDDVASSYFTDQSPFRRIFQQQITDLILTNEKDIEVLTERQYQHGVHGYILKFFESLKHLSINGSSALLTLRDSSPTTCFSSTLTKLCVDVDCFQSCLILLDGRLKQLTTLIVKIDHSKHSSGFHNQDDLPNLKSFSFEYRCQTNEFDIQVLPLLRRMSNLEELTLKIINDDRTTFVDGTVIHHQILVHLPRLHIFNFYICTITDLHYLAHHLSSDDIQQTFTKIGFQHVRCIVCYNFRNTVCHVFSLPFIYDHLDYIGNMFPPLVFTNVTKLKVSDVVPFKREFFIRLAQSFPCLKDLSVSNCTPQSRRSDNVCSDHNQQYPIIEYRYLDSLCLEHCYIDYMEQLLDETKTRLPRLKKLTIKCTLLLHITKYFTRDVTRLNCANVKQLITGKAIPRLKKFHSYFPSLEYSSCSDFFYYYS